MGYFIHQSCSPILGSRTGGKVGNLRPEEIGLMSPFSDCSLEAYYGLAAGHADRLSLLSSFFGCLASAVAYLHAQKIRHRDIKPQNIIVREDEVFLADFGIASS